MTVSADQIPLTTFCRWIADRAGVSIVVEDRLESRMVTLDVRDVAVNDVLGMVARRVGSQVTRVGKLYYLGELRPEDKGVLVRKVSRLSQEELQQAVEVLLSDYGSASTYADGLLVVGDRVEVLQRIQELLDGVEAADASSWVVQFYVVSLNQSDMIDLGLDAMPALEVAATVAGASNGGLTALANATKATTNIKGGLDLVLRASRERASVAILGQPLFLMYDGQKAHIGSGQRLPIPQRTVSNQGTVSTNGYTYIDTGFQLDVQLREVGQDRARISIDVALSSLQGYVEAAPIVAKDSYTAASVISSGGVYLLGSLERKMKDTKKSNLLTLGGRDVESSQVVQVWARAYRVAGPLRSEPSGATERSEANEEKVFPSVVVDPFADRYMVR